MQNVYCTRSLQNARFTELNSTHPRVQVKMTPLSVVPVDELAKKFALTAVVIWSTGMFRYFCVGAGGGDGGFVGAGAGGGGGEFVAFVSFAAITALAGRRRRRRRARRMARPAARVTKSGDAFATRRLRLVVCTYFYTALLGNGIFVVIDGSCANMSPWRGRWASSSLGSRPHSSSSSDFLHARQLLDDFCL